MTGVTAPLSSREYPRGPIGNRIVIVAIDYFGHSALPPDQTEALLARLRREHPALQFHPAGRLEFFDAEIAREFGIEAKAKFMVSLIDKARIGEVPGALSAVYQAFGPDHLVITEGHDRAIPPPPGFPAMPKPEPHRGQNGGRFLLSVLAFIGGWIAGYLAIVLGYMIWAEATAFFDREGATSMGVLFFMGPAGGFVTGLLAAAITWRLRGRRLRATS